MRACLIVLLVGLLLGAALADSDNGMKFRVQALEDLTGSLVLQVRDYRRQIELLSFESKVLRQQFLYNRDIDRAFSIGYTQAYSADFNTSVDRIMTHFCPDALFWAAYVNGVPVLTADSHAGIRGVYAAVSATNYANFSRHVITNPMPTHFVGSDGSDYIELNASIVQPAIKRVNGGLPFLYVDGSPITDAVGIPKIAPYTWNWSVGWYHNQWRRNVDGSVCMTRFEAWTMSQHDFSATFTHDAVLDASLL